MKMLRPPVVMKLISIMVFTISICGCIQDRVVVKLDPDGSGTIEETITASMFMDEIKKECDKDCPTEDHIAAEMTRKTMDLARNNAEEFGENVRLISVKPTRTDKTAGSIAVYRFDDINKISIDRDLMSRAGGFMKGHGSDDQRIKFLFTKGPPAELKITVFPGEQLDDETDLVQAGPYEDDFHKSDPEGDELLRSCKMYVGLEINGSIVKSNATYQTGKVIPLIDVSFESLLEKDSVLKKFQKEPPRSIRQYKEMIKGVKGFKLEMTNPVIIEFK